MRNVYIGVDPGKAGFVTVIKDEEFIFFPMPEHKVETGKLLKSGKPQMKTVFHEAGLKTLKQEIELLCDGYHIKAAIEEVGGRGGWSSTNNFNFGYTAGLQKMILIMLDADIIMVRPQKWQSVMRQGYPDIKKSSSTGKTQVRDPKAVAEMIVKAEWPEIDFRKTERSKTNDDNKIDSFLVAQYLKRQNE